MLAVKSPEEKIFFPGA